MNDKYIYNKPENFIEVNEAGRVYHFNDRSIYFEGVREIAVRPSGSHRLNLVDGRKIVVPVGWLALEIHGLDKWVF